MSNLIVSQNYEHLNEVRDKNIDNARKVYYLAVLTSDNQMKFETIIFPEKQRSEPRVRSLQPDPFGSQSNAMPF